MILILDSEFCTFHIFVFVRIVIIHIQLNDFIYKNTITFIFYQLLQLLRFFGLPPRPPGPPPGRSLDNLDRSFKAGEDHRTSTLKTIEQYLSGMGGVVGNGHACVLRAICEVI